MFVLFTSLECDLGKRSTVCVCFEAVNESLKSKFTILCVFLCTFLKIVIFSTVYSLSCHSKPVRCENKKKIRKYHKIRS